MAANVSGHLNLVKRKRGDVWYLKYRTASGKQIQKKLGPAWTGKGKPAAGFYTRRMAQDALDAVLTDIRRGVVDPEGTGATFDDAAAEYLRYVIQIKQIDKRTQSDYRGVINRYLLPEFGGQPVESVTPDMIDAYKERLILEGRLSNRVIVRHLNVLHGIFKRARRVWRISENPASAELVERPQVVYTGEFDMYDQDEIELLASHAANVQDAAIFKVAAFTGLRQGELIALRWDCVDFIGGMLHVRRNFTGGVEKIPKGKKVRSVPMMPDVIDTLAALKERGQFTADDDLVFGSEVGDHIDHYKLRKRFYKARDAAGLRPLRFHDLRHCFGSAAIQMLDGDKVQAYMGHAHYSTTQRYLHHKPRREDAVKIAEAFALTVHKTIPKHVPKHVPKSEVSGVTGDTSTQLKAHPLAEAA